MGLASPPAQQRPGAATRVPQDPGSEFASPLQVGIQSRLPSSRGMRPASRITPAPPISPGSDPLSQTVFSGACTGPHLFCEPLQTLLLLRLPVTLMPTPV